MVARRRLIALLLLLGPGADLKPLGHLLEIVPEQDPAIASAGQPFAVQVLFLGTPLAGARPGIVRTNRRRENSSGHDRAGGGSRTRTTQRVRGF